MKNNENLKRIYKYLYNMDIKDKSEILLLLDFQRELIFKLIENNIDYQINIYNNLTLDICLNAEYEYDLYLDLEDNTYVLSRDTIIKNSKNTNEIIDYIFTEVNVCLNT